MSMYQCERCGQYKDGDFDTFHVTKLPGEKEDKPTCEYCADELCDRADQGEIKTLILDYQKYTPNA